MPNPNPSAMGPDSNPSFGMNGWQVEASPPSAGDVRTPFGLANPKPMFAIRIHCSSGVSGSLVYLTDAGVAAVRAQCTAYLTAAKMAEIRSRDKYMQTPTFLVSTGHCWMDALPEDGPTQIAALCALFQTAANVTTGSTSR